MVNLNLVVFGLNDTIKIVCVRKEASLDYGGAIGELVALDEVWIERVQDEYVVEFGTVGEIGPIERICHIVLFNAAIDVAYFRIDTFFTFSYIYGIIVDIVAEFGKNF